MSRHKNPFPLGQALPIGSSGLVLNTAPAAYTPTITQTGNTFSAINFSWARSGPFVTAWGVFTAVSTVTNSLTISVPTTSGTTIATGAAVGFLFLTTGATIIPLGYSGGAVCQSAALTAGAVYGVTFTYPTTALS